MIERMIRTHVSPWCWVKKSWQTARSPDSSEFMKHFSQKLNELHLIHYHTYPKTPKMNAHCERFNRTIQEEFVEYHAGLLLNPSSFNQKLIPWLVWYNTERPHWGLDLKSPMQFMLTAHPEKSNMWWTNTKSKQTPLKMI
jgi:transposase InsO family protein